MIRTFPKRGDYLVGLAHNQLLGETELGKKIIEGIEIVNHLAFAHAYTKSDALIYAEQGYTIFRVEPGLRLQKIDFYPNITKFKPFDIPSDTETYKITHPKKIPREESVFGCKYCSVKHLKKNNNATTCEKCNFHLRCNSCGRCICEKWS